ncbi:unnamed protein product [Arabis nemorensis]|uniref:RNase H type-1 domain-containing protein n=1 Tax=Arabis nemorensis TaxID=586526 RepID=A0A565B9L1_9BRAS|nr:unnamed protein product [Arabis nemorensis]
MISEEETHRRAINDVEEWVSTLGDTNENIFTQPMPTQQQVRWKPPASDWVKCNYDVSHREGNQNSGLGWIIKNSNGIFLEAGMGKFEGRETVEEAECTTLLWATQSAWALGYPKVEFEGDNLIINRVINNNIMNLKLQHHITAITNWKANFLYIKFTYRKRTANECADLLAKTSIISSSPWIRTTTWADNRAQTKVAIS